MDINYRSEYQADTLSLKSWIQSLKSDALGVMHTKTV